MASAAPSLARRTRSAQAPADRWLSAILRADVYDLARRTPLDPAPRLSTRLGQQVLLKREDQQPVFSFKLRGAINRLRTLSQEQRRRGVLAVSAGNHAQGVALAARRLHVEATILMPVTTPAIKVEAVRELGARVVLHGDSYDEAATHGMHLASQRGATLIHPYDDAEVIAGQGTVAMELLAQHPGPLDAVFIPVGGGGLAAGMAAYIKAVRPDIRVVAVEPADAACLQAALEAGRPVPLAEVGLFVDGCAVRQVGALNFEVLKDRIDEVVTVDADQVCAAIRDVFEDTRGIVEPAGALAVAGLKKWSQSQARRDLHLAAVLSGANMGFDRLAHVAERAELGERHEALFGVTIPERKGAFLDFCRALGRRAVTEFNYRHGGGPEAEIFVGVRLREGEAERQAIAAALATAGYRVMDLSEDEIARLHVRHMVGGRAAIARERMIRFEFPERPGALLQFLETLGNRWNISLFHYRNHGAAYGRVLAGFEVATEDDAAFYTDLARLGFTWREESGNPALHAFLGR
jgi:threonine dehydratase